MRSEILLDHSLYGGDCRCYTHIFDSIEDMVKYSEFGNANTNWQDAKSDTYISNSPDNWLGRKLNGWKDAFKRALEGWDDGIKLIGDMKGKINGLHERVQDIKIIKRKAVWAEDDGNEFDRERLFDGEPYWRKIVRQATLSCEIVHRIIVNVGSTCENSWEKMAWKVVAVAVLADLLENAGYRIEVYGARYGKTTYNGGHNNFTMYKIKSAEDSVSIADIITGCAPWFYRTVGFASFYDKNNTVSFGLGCSKSLMLAPDTCKQLLGEKYILVENIWSSDDAVRFLNESITLIQGKGNSGE